jgi:hypothetical protein
MQPLSAGNIRHWFRSALALGSNWVKFRSWAFVFKHSQRSSLFDSLFDGSDHGRNRVMLFP